MWRQWRGQDDVIAHHHYYKSLIVGPLIVLYIYITDLPCSLSCSKARMFAGNTKFTIDLDSMVNYGSESTKQWLTMNRLMLNVV